MSITNDGIVAINGSKIEAQNISVGQNATISIGNQINTKWSKVDNWLQENRKNIQNYEALQEQINTLKAQINSNLSKEEKDSIFKKIADAIGSFSDAIGLIQLVKEIF
jgi:hypothetical protein